MTSRASRNLGGWHTGWCWNLWFNTDCTTLWLHCVFAAAVGSAGVCGCSLGVMYWCATNLVGVAAGASNMYGFCGACIWV